MRTDTTGSMNCAGLFTCGFFAAIDYHFARFVTHAAGCDHDDVMLAAALASRQTRMGHACFDLSKPEPGDDALDVPRACPQPETWRSLLLEAGCVGVPGEAKPLILDKHNRLYLYRMYAREQRLAEHLLARAAQTTMPGDAKRFAQGFARLFPDDTDACLRLAAYSAIVKPLCVICGGPGTGKTTTAARILALLLEQSARGQRIALAAPTGKAAERLQKSVARALGALPADAGILGAIPREAATLHRLLGMQPRRPRGRYSDGRMLPVDIVVVDEASMVDLSIMCALFDALRPDARVILLGDHKQLASVAPGSVLGDLFRAGSCSRYSDSFVQGFSAAGQAAAEGLADGAAGLLDDCLNELVTNYRFPAESGIARLSAAVTSGNGSEAAALLGSAATDIHWQPLPKAASFAGSLRNKVIEGFQGYCSCRDPLDALARFDDFRILCAVREGPFGVQALNALVEEALAAEGLITQGKPWYHGRPVIIIRNHYPLRLFNGDIGIVFEIEKGRPLRVCFAGQDGELRTIGTDQLPLHETAFATTVHKAQGAEFDRVLLLLPDRSNPVLTRELIYTGITRVRSRIDLWADAEVLQLAIDTKIERSSGLYDALQHGGDATQYSQGP
jgi:exodeoxyribonuclease V alpha subunit